MRSDIVRFTDIKGMDEIKIVHPARSAVRCCAARLYTSIRQALSMAPKPAATCSMSANSVPLMNSQRTHPSFFRRITLRPE